MTLQPNTFQRSLTGLGVAVVIVAGAAVGMLFLRPVPANSPAPEGRVAGEEVQSQSVTTLFPHIKTWNIFLSVEHSAPEDTFAGMHYDIVGGRIDKDVVYNVNPNALFCGYFNVPTAKASTGNFVTWTTNNGYDPEDFILHYGQDTTNVLLGQTIPGWNPSCSPSGCTPAATANSEAEARVPGNADHTWSWWNLNDPRFVQYVDWQDEQFLAYTNTPIKCYFLDSVPQFWQTLNAIGFSTVTEYAGIPLNNSHPHITKLFTWGVDLMNYVQQHRGISVIGMPNLTATSVNNAEPFKSLNETNYQWDWIENWSAFTNSDVSVNGVTPTSYEQDYNGDVVQILAQLHTGYKRLVRGYEIYGRESNRGKLFVLSNFYLINGPNAYFSYQTFNAPGADDIPTKKWFDAIGYDIGLPIPNQTTGGPDYAGNSGTSEHYEWATGVDPSNTSKTYHILARDYSKALVLLKYRPQGDTEGDASLTTHNLGGTFRPLNVDGTLGAPITQISLHNNEGAILIRETPIDGNAPDDVTDLQAH